MAVETISIFARAEITYDPAGWDHPPVLVAQVGHAIEKAAWHFLEQRMALAVNVHLDGDCILDADRRE